jgi:HAD superfamily phosphoserine phosphatase-like hydrolase
MKEEIGEVKELSGKIAAFFDLDGTLVALPSLERRLFQRLRKSPAIQGKNYLLWLAEAVRLLPRGINGIFQGNKMYLRGVRIIDECDERSDKACSRHEDGHQGGGRAPEFAQSNARLPVPFFLEQGVERVAWHAKQGHEIVLLSGTLEPLAREAARTLEGLLAGRGIEVAIRVMATRLEEKDGKWTGRVLGEAMFGEVKARAARQLATEMRFDLEKCYAYGDSLSDRWLLESVGRAAAVNPPNDLASIARKRGWPRLNWEKEESLTQRRAGRRGIAEKTRQHSASA